MNCINHDTSINYCELYGIWMIVNDYLNFVNYHYLKNNFKIFKNIQIFTDSQFVCNILNINGYPEFDDHYRLMQKIFKIVSKLSVYGIVIEIVKIPSHSGIEENTLADHIANRAASIAKDCKYGNSNIINYDKYFNPIQIDISIDLKRLHYIHRQDRLHEWKLQHKKWKNGTLDENMYEGGMLFHKMMLGHNGYVKRQQMI